MYKMEEIKDLREFAINYELLHHINEWLISKDKKHLYFIKKLMNQDNHIQNEKIEPVMSLNRFKTRSNHKVLF